MAILAALHHYRDSVGLKCRHTEVICGRVQYSQTRCQNVLSSVT